MLPVGRPGDCCAPGASPPRAAGARSATRSGSTSPWYVQYLKYLERLVFHFDFGYSYQNNVSVKSQIFDRLPATIALAVGAAIVWLLVGIPVGIISAIKRGTWMDRVGDGLGARRRSRRRSTGSASSRSTCSPRTSASSRSSRAGRLPDDRQHLHRPGAGDPVADHAVVRARRVVRRDLRPLPARQPARGDVRGLHPHRARQGAARADASCSSTACARRSRRSSRSSASTSASCSAARSSPRRSSTSPASAAWPSTPIQKSDLPTVQGTVLMGAFFIIFLNLIVDIVYAFLDPRVRYSLAPCSKSRT